MNDLETILGARLDTLADDLTPVVDPRRQVADARARHHRQRRTRIAFLALATATAAVLVGSAVAVDLLSAQNEGQVAVPGYPAPTTAAPVTTAPVAPTPAAPLEPPTASPVDPVAEAELAQAVALLGEPLQYIGDPSQPVAFEGPPPESRCSWLDPGPISHWIGTRLASSQGKALTDGSGCRFANGSLGPGVTGTEGLVVGIGYLAETSVGDSSQTVDPSGACRTADVLSTPAGAVAQRCAAPGATHWWLHAPAVNGGVYVLEVAVADNWTGITAPVTLVRLSTFLSRSW